MGESWLKKYLKVNDEINFSRVQHSLLSGLNYCVLGLGNSLYKDHYNVVARKMDKFLFQLSASRQAFTDDLKAWLAFFPTSKELTNASLVPSWPQFGQILALTVWTHANRQTPRSIEAQQLTA